MSVFIIAECGSSHDNDLAKAHRLIDAAKECGADAVKAQFWSNSKALADRRKLPLAEPIYAKYKLPQGWLPILAEYCEKRQIEFMCTSYLIEDIPVIAPYVKRFKVSAYEANWSEFVQAHYYQFKETIISSNDAANYSPPGMKLPGSARRTHTLHCISKYPTPLEELNLETCHYEGVDGFSDHTANVLTGAAAVAAGAQIIEAHIRLSSTDPANPDYPHSLVADSENPEVAFSKYVSNIRTVERML